MGNRQTKEEPCFNDYVLDKLKEIRPNEINNACLGDIAYINITSDRKMIDNDNNEVCYGESFSYKKS